MTTLLLFDLDGTLLSGNAGRRAFKRAFAELANVADATAGIVFAGKTDTRLFQEAIAAHQLHAVDSAAAAGVYLRCLAEEMAAGSGQLLPGVQELLAALASEPEVYLALGTGNMEAGARIKLTPHGIGHYFPVGGFDSDSGDRKELIRLGIGKAEKYYSTTFTRVVVIGDTPLDVACGKANGAATVAVATGPYTAAELEACGADRVFQNFSQIDRVVAALLTVRPSNQV